MVPLQAALVVIMIVVAVAVSAPLLFELVLTVGSGLGFNRIRTHARSIRLNHLANLVSDKAEYAVLGGVLSMIVVAIYLHFSDLVYHESITHFFLLHVIPSIWINCNLLFHLYQAVFRDPGRPSTTTMANAMAKPVDGTSGVRWCRACDAPKPPRTHHCSTCGRCCLYQDHHCPFTASCIGAGNYQYFFAFVFWGALATSYAVWIAYHPYSHCRDHALPDDPSCQDIWGSKRRLFSVSVAVAAVLWLFLAFVVYLLVTGQTTRSFLTKHDGDPLAPLRRFGRLSVVQFRLGPVRAWWRYLVPFALLGMPPYDDVDLFRL